MSLFDHTPKTLTEINRALPELTTGELRDSLDNLIRRGYLELGYRNGCVTYHANDAALAVLREALDGR